MNYNNHYYYKSPNHYPPPPPPPPPYHGRQPPPPPPHHGRQPPPPPHLGRKPPPPPHLGRKPPPPHRGRPPPPHYGRQPPPPPYHGRPPPPPPPYHERQPPPPPYHERQPPPPPYHERQPPPPPPPLPPHHERQPPPPPHHRRAPAKHNNKRTTLSSCIVATIFLVFLIIILLIIYFSLFKPKDPSVSVTAIQLPSFTVSTNSTTVSFTFSLYAAIKNTNRATFSHYDSTLQLLYAGNQVGFMFIPAGNVHAQKTDFITAIFSVQSFPLTSTSSDNNWIGAPKSVGNVPVSDGIERIKPTMELEMRLDVVGRVRVLWVFNHHLETVSDCRVIVSIPDGSVLGFHC